MNPALLYHVPPHGRRRGCAWRPCCSCSPRTPVLCPAARLRPWTMLLKDVCKPAPPRRRLTAHASTNQRCAISSNPTFDVTLCGRRHSVPRCHVQQAAAREDARQNAAHVGPVGRKRFIETQQQDCRPSTTHVLPAASGARTELCGPQSGLARMCSDEIVSMPPLRTHHPNALYSR